MMMVVDANVVVTGDVLAIVLRVVGAIDAVAIV